MHHITRFIAVITATVLLTACGDGSGSGSSTGKLNLSITDAPVDNADHVWVEFTGVELKLQGGAALQIDYFAGDEKKSTCLICKELYPNR